MGIKYAGWLCGMIILFGAAAVTSYTAKLLAKCMDLDPSLITFSDLAYISFGRNARIATNQTANKSEYKTGDALTLSQEAAHQSHLSLSYLTLKWPSTFLLTTGVPLASRARTSSLSAPTLTVPSLAVLLMVRYRTFCST